jgi:hypothetical protein
MRQAPYAEHLDDDILDIRLNDAPIARTLNLGHWRNIDLDDHGRVVADRSDAQATCSIGVCGAAAIRLRGRMSAPIAPAPPPSPVPTACRPPIARTIPPR